MVVIRNILGVHRTAVPIDHPDGSVTRTKLEYPTVDVSFTYLDAINKLVEVPGSSQIASATVDVFSDKAIEGLVSDRSMTLNLRTDKTWNNRYTLYVDSNATTADFVLSKAVNGSPSIITNEAVDLDAGSSHVAKLSASGSTLKGFRGNLDTPKITATDTDLASGSVQVGSGFARTTAFSLTYFLRAPASPSQPAMKILEVDLEGSGRPEDPYRPAMSRNLVKVTSLTGLPDFLYREAKKYEMLKSKGFTDEEIQLLLGYIPQHKVDLDSVTWGAFELHPKDSTVVITITGDNPYSSGAIERQKGKVKRVFKPPKDYSEAVALYNSLRADYPYWLAGKENFAYQTLGWEELDLMQNVDFYYGELIEHRTHYSQLKRVDDDEIRRRIEEIIGKLSKVGGLKDERDKHVGKAKEILKRGW